MYYFVLDIVYAYIPYDISIIFIPIIIELIVYQIIIIFEKQNFILLLNNRGLPIFNSQRSGHIYCFSGKGQLKITKRHVTFKPVVI